MPRLIQTRMKSEVNGSEGGEGREREEGGGKKVGREARGRGRGGREEGGW